MKRLKLIIAIFTALVTQTFALSTTVVTKTADDGTIGTLRYALTSAIGAGSGTVTIQTTGTITLLSALPVITAPITVVCTDATGITISGNGLYRVFEVNIASGTVSFTNLNITNGSAAGGGGVYASTSTNGKVSFENCTITGCVATGSQAYGGAIESSADVDLLNCTITGNSAVDGGGAIEMFEELGVSVLTITNCTIVQNSTAAFDIAGGIDVYKGILNIRNSIVGTNTNGNNSSARDIGLDIGNVNGQLSQSNVYTTAPFTGAGDLVNSSVGQLGLSPLANNGGRVKTMAIGLASLARNSGLGGLAATDARGVARDANPDRGAYEAPSPTATTNPASDITTTTATLNGVYNPLIYASHSAVFEYGSSTGNLTNTVAATVAPSTYICSYSLTGQPSGSKIYYRLVATIDGVKFFGAEEVFTLNIPTSQELTPIATLDIVFDANTKSINVLGDFDYLEAYDLLGNLLVRSNSSITKLSNAKGIVIVRVYSTQGVKTRKIAL